MKYIFRRAEKWDAEAVLEIYNYFVNNTWASYREKEAGHSYVAHLFEATKHHPFYVVESENKIIGWGLTKAYSTIEKERQTAECSYFILPDYTGQGIGKALLKKLIADSTKIGVRVLLVSIMEKNTQSIGFHRSMGFRECGRFHSVIRKWGEDVDLVWMEKHIAKGEDGRELG